MLSNVKKSVSFLQRSLFFNAGPAYFKYLFTKYFLMFFCIITAKNEFNKYS